MTRLIGKPKLPPSKRRKYHVIFRMNKAELAVIGRAAKLACLQRSIWVRQVLLKAAGVKQ